MPRNIRSSTLEDASEEYQDSRGSASKASSSRRPRRSRPSGQSSSPAHIASPSPEPEDTKHSAGSSSSRPHETQFVNDSDEDLWTAECILDERGPPRTGEYLIQWAGRDPATGDPWDPSWEPRGNVTRPLADEWKGKKKANPAVVGIESGKLEDKLKAKRAEERAKKRKRDSFARKPKKKRRNSRGRASASTGAGTPSVIEIEQEPAEKSVPEDINAGTPKNAEADLDGLRDAVLRLDDAPPETGAIVPNEAGGVDTTEANGTERREEDNRSDSDVVEITPHKSGNPARPTTNDSPNSAAGTRKGGSDGSPRVEVVLRGSKLADKSAGNEKRVRVDSVPITIGASDIGVSKKKDSAPVQTDTEPAAEEAGEETDRPEAFDQADDVPEKGPASPPRRDGDTAETSNMTPIIIPDADQFRSFLPSTRTANQDNSQSTNSIGPSQLDPISQFSSPLRGPTQNGPNKKTAATKLNGHIQAPVKEPAHPAPTPAPAPAEPAEDVQSSSKSMPVITTRLINGEEVMAIESQSDSDETEDMTQVRSQAPAGDEVMDVDATSPSATRTVASENNHQEAETDQEQDLETTEEHSSRDVVIHTTQVEYTETITETPLPTLPSPAPDQSAEVARSDDQQLAEAAAEREEMLRAANLQAEEIQKLRAELEAKEAEIVRLSVIPIQSNEPLTANVTTPAPTSRPVSRASSPTTSSLKLASKRDALLAESANSPQSLVSSSGEHHIDDTVGPERNLGPLGISGPGPSTGRRTANSSTPPAHMTSASADFALRLAKKDGLIRTARQRADKAEADHESTRQQLAFVQSQYQNASDSAVREVSKANELQEQVDRLRDQLKFGLKQREMITSSVKLEHAKEIAKLQGQLKVLLDQNRATDDVVRSRAAAYKDLKAENSKLQSEVRAAFDKNQQLSARNDRLLGEVELFRAREMGVIGPNAVPPSDSDDSTYTTDSDDDDAEDSPPPPQRPAPPIRAKSPPKPAIAPLQPVEPITLVPECIPLETVKSKANDTTEIREGQAYPSPWTPGLYFADEAVSLPLAPVDQG